MKMSIRNCTLCVSMFLYICLASVGRTHKHKRKYIVVNYVLLFYRTQTTVLIICSMCSIWIEHARTLLCWCNIEQKHYGYSRNKVKRKEGNKFNFTFQWNQWSLGSFWFLPITIDFFYLCACIEVTRWSHFRFRNTYSRTGLEIYKQICKPPYDCKAWGINLGKELVRLSITKQNSIINFDTI